MVLIIGMLMALLAPRIWGQLAGAKRKDALVREPTTEPRPKRYPAGGYASSKALIDPWQNPYHYDRPGSSDGDNADIGNWESSTSHI